LGFQIASTSGTADQLKEVGVDVLKLHKLADQTSPNVLDLMKKGSVSMILNTPSGPVARVDEIKIRSEAILRGVPIVTTEAGARATLSAIQHMRFNDWSVRSLQEYFEQ